MKQIKVGIVGAGFSAMAHLQVLMQLPNVKVVALAATSSEKARNIASHFKINKSYDDAVALIQDPEVQVVHNCTTNDMHFPLNRLILSEGKHLLSEKPLALNSEQSEQLCRMEEDKQSVTGICFNYRYYPLVAEIKHALNSDKYGRVHFVHGGYLQDWLLQNTDYNWRLLPERSGPSRAIADIGSHWCDTVQYILGKRIVSVMADLNIVHTERISADGLLVPIQTEDYGSVLVQFEDGIRGVFFVSQVSSGHKNKLFFEFNSETATFAWDQELPNQLWIGRRNEANRVLVKDPRLLSASAAALTRFPGGHQEGWPDALKNMIIDYYDAVSNHIAGRITDYKYSFATISEGHYIMKIVESILESNKTGNWTAVAIN